MIYPLGWFADNQAVSSLIFAIVFDIFTGLLAAWAYKKIASAASFQGMLKKVSLLFMVGLGALLQPYTPIPGLAANIATFFFITEAISIAENLARLGVPMPKQLKEVLAVMKAAHGVTDQTTTTTATTTTAPPDPMGIIQAVTSTTTTTSTAPGDQHK